MLKLDMSSVILDTASYVCPMALKFLWWSMCSMR